MENNLLYLNLAIDKNDTSLGFASSWIGEVSKLYSHIDVVTLRSVSYTHLTLPTLLIV